MQRSKANDFKTTPNNLDKYVPIIRYQKKNTIKKTENIILL